jgi:hypothetical protein
LRAYITGSVDDELLRRNEYLVAENRILRKQIQGRLGLSDGERKTLAEMGKRLGKQALAEVTTIVKPDTIRAWHRQLITQKVDGAGHRRAPGRPPIDQALEALVMRLAQENRSGGYDRIAGALANVGSTIRAQTSGNIWKRHGIAPAPQRQKMTTGKELIRTHLEVLVATDFFTTEVWTKGGLVTSSVLFFIPLASRQVQVAGVTPDPQQGGMTQLAPNVTMAEWGFLAPGHSLIHARDAKYCPAVQRTIDETGVKRVVLPARSPNLNAYAERWVKSVKEECLSRQMLFGERALRQALAQYHLPYHHERNPQGQGTTVLLPVASQVGKRAGSIHCQERLGGLRKYYSREAA